MARSATYAKWWVIRALPTQSTNPHFAQRNLQIVQNHALPLTYLCTYSHYRYGKPFNPLLGETYELVHQEGEFCVITEQVCHHITISLHHSITIAPHHNITTSPYHHITISQYHHITTSQYHHSTTSQYHHITISPHHHITISPYHYITVSP